MRVMGEDGTMYKYVCNPHIQKKVKKYLSLGCIGSAWQVLRKCSRLD